MKELEIRKIENQVPSIRNYLTEINLIEEVLDSNNLIIQDDSKAVFWNHFAELFLRIDSSEMNVLEIDKNFIPSHEALDLTHLLKVSLDKIRIFTLTEFEEFLLMIYIQKLIEERET